MTSLPSPPPPLSTILFTFRTPQHLALAQRLSSLANGDYPIDSHQTDNPVSRLEGSKRLDSTQFSYGFSPSFKFHQYYLSISKTIMTSSFLISSRGHN
jgi:hypothetical protein